jgi:predicted alpha-1,2-mannosidase
MPVTGTLKTNVDAYSIFFSHDNEIASPAYYKLTTQNIITEISATLRCGIMRFTMLKDDSLYLLAMPNSDQSQGFVKIDTEKGIILGYNPAHRIYQGWGQPAGFNGWFYIKIEKEIKSKGTFSGDNIFDTDSIKIKKDVGAFAGFKLKKGDQLVIKIGTSFSSLEGAKKNLEAEIGNKSFNEIQIIAKQVWEKALSQIRVYTNNIKHKRIFYTSMYHAMEMPRLFNDVDGTYPKFSAQYELMNSGKSHNGYRDYYDDLSMWDVYRAQLPLLELLQPARINDIVQSVIWKGEQGGWLPIFPCWNNYTAAMIGDHATAL